MRKTFTTPVILAFLLITISLRAQHLPWREGEMQVRIETATEFRAQEAINAIHAAGLNGYNISYEEGNGFIRCYVTQAEYGYLVQKNLQPLIEIEDLNSHSAAMSPAGVPPGYYTVDELNLIADSLSLNFPGICSKHFIGMSSFTDSLFALKISDNTALDENEPEVLFDGGIHGDEIGGPENLIRFARDLCMEYGSNPDITNAVDNAETWIIYCINPYGRDNMTRYNANGVDVNRDCGYMWNGEGNSSGAFSQAEAKVLRNMLTSHQFVIHISYHSGTEFISYPWSYREELCPDDPNHEYLAIQYAQNSGYSNIPYGPGFTGMYAINGSTKDFGYGATGAISWSVEISMSKQPSASQVVPYYLKNKDAMLSMITNAVAQGIRGTVTDALTGEPVDALIFINNFFPVNTGSVNGDYHKFLVAGTYTVRVEANGYLPQEFAGITITDGNITVVDASLERGGGYFARALDACYIPNNNPADEGNTPACLGDQDNTKYSIGRSGYVVLDMGTPVLNRTGNDVKVYENDQTVEGYKVYGGNTPDGPWFLLGTGSGNMGFDLSATMLVKARYFKITDDGDGTSQAPDAGFDLDAVENIHPDTLTVGYISGVIYNDQMPYFTIPNASVTLNGNQFAGDEAGNYLVPCVPGTTVLFAEAPYYEGTDTVMVVIGDTLIHDMYLSLTESVDIQRIPGITISPVPANNYFTVYAPEGMYTMELFDNSGLKVDELDFAVNAGGFTYRTKSLTSGLYIARIRSENYTVVKKIIIR